SEWQVDMADMPEDQPADSAARRDFIRQLAVLFAAAGAGLGGTAHAQAAPTSAGRGGPAQAAPHAPPNNLAGMQMGPHTMLDEGIEHVLDLIQETAAIDTIFVYSHSYGGDLKKPLSMLATDHGMPPKPQQTRNLPNVWVKQHDQ